MKLSAIATVVALVVFALAQTAQAFTAVRGVQHIAGGRCSAVGSLEMSCKRNTKDEKRARNREAARRDRTRGSGTNGKSRRRTLKLARINEVVNKEAEFMASAFLHVTEEPEKVNPLANV
uniref:BZIP domain-containing protein n=1 Tax=Pinguiococcus pyrenoidosus TaxID=172671 RepID=A0A7R9UCA2_9STRA|mmetsp:Transcript_4878/g.19538  ORF Transcript_4878/g.19538 Transcript_4878/m.19538 type:complete len:120 (+) Transcript_4878:74-433(+)